MALLGLMWDVIIVGGGPAGLSAAIMLGRCRHSVLVVDGGRPRHATARHIHGYPTRDGVAPERWRGLARKEAAAYRVVFRRDDVVKVTPGPKGFLVRTRKGERWAARLVLLATGLMDELPAIPGLRERYGKSVFHCPYCDAWEVRDKPLAVYGRKTRGVALALNLRSWSGEVRLFTDGPAEIRAPVRARLRLAGVHVHHGAVAGLEGKRGSLQRIRMADGTAHPCSALFFCTPHRGQSTIAADLGCRINRNGEVVTDTKQGTHLPGLYVAGDASEDMRSVTVAVAEGAKAAVAMHIDLLKAKGWA
ncbi:MAG: NAD(P)/FAD-dependent oxidoreductase [Flavobacteriales bacterium]